jgi:hypothetical protein
MPQQLLLEGPDLEALIVRAKQEYGPGARVVRAEKVRSGGFLGFFTHERFELTVEVSDADIAEAAATRAPVEVVRSRTADEAALAAEIEDARSARESMLSGTLGTPATSSGSGRVDDAGPSRPAGFTADAPAAARDSFAASLAARAASSRDIAEFDRMVLSLTQEAEGSRAETDSAGSGSSDAGSPDIGSSDTDTPESGTPAPSIAFGETPTPSSPLGRPFVPASFPVAERGVPAGARNTALAVATPAVETPAATTAALTEAAVFETAVSETAASESAPSESRDRAQRVGGVVLHKWGVFTDIASAVSTHCTVPALLSLGVPMRCVEDYADLAAPVPLLDVVARFGTPPVKRPEAGDLILVAGQADHAVAVATQLAAWVGLPPTSVVLAGDIAAIRGHGRRIKDATQARTMRARADKAAQLGEPLIVALGVAPGRRGAASAAPMLAAFDADTAWAVIDATKRPATYEPSVGLLAGESRIDALAAVNMAEAQAPCAVLDASLPVAWMDGLPAAGVVWAALLGERIAALD